MRKETVVMFYGKINKVELAERISFYIRENKLVEAQRIEQRTRHDLEMLNEICFCKGIENYSRHLSGCKPGEPPTAQGFSYQTVAH